MGHGVRERGRRSVGLKVKEGRCVLVGQLKGFEPKGEGDVFSIFDLRNLKLESKEFEWGFIGDLR